MATESSLKVQEFVAHSTEVSCLTFSSRSQIFATGGQDHKVNVWNVGNSASLWSLGSNKSPIQSLCFDSEEQYVVSGTTNGSIKVFDLNEGRLARQLAGHQVNVTCLQYHAFGEFVVSGSSDCTMKVWDVRSKKCLQTYTGHEKEVTCVRFSPDGRWVASSSKDGQLHIWDIVAGKNLQSFKIGPSTHVTSFEFNPLELMLAAITSSRTIKLYDLETMRPISSTPPDSSHVRAICYTNDDKSVCSATKDNLKLWNWDPTMKLIGAKDVPWDKVAEIRTTSENKVVGGSFASNFVSIWSVDLAELSPPAVKSSAVIPIGNGESKQTSRNLLKSESKSTNSQFINGSGSPGDKSTARGQWSDNRTNSNLPPSPGRVSSSPLNKKSQDLFAKALSQGKSPPDNRSTVLSYPEMIIPSFELPESIAIKQDIIDLPQPKTDIPFLEQRSDIRIDVRDIQLDSKSDYKSPNKFEKLLESKPQPKPEAKSSVRADLRPRCMDLLDGPSDMDVYIESFDESLGLEPPSTPPRVTWESEHAAMEMATSLGESFWRRFQESRALANAANPLTKPSSISDQAKEEDLVSRKLHEVKELEPDKLSGLSSLLPQSRFSDKIIPAPESEKVMADFRELRVGPSQSDQQASISVKQSLDALISSSAVFTTTLSQRLTSLRVLKRLWEKGDIDAVIDHLSTLLDTIDEYTANTTISPSISNLAASAATSPIIQQSLEFFANIDFYRTSGDNGKLPSISFDQAVKFMGILNSTLRVRSSGDITRMSKIVISYQVEVVIVKVIQLHDLFGDLIKQARLVNASAGAGVDLVRDDRIRKYKQINGYVERLREKIKIVLSSLKDSGIGVKLRDILTRFQDLVR